MKIIEQSYEIKEFPKDPTFIIEDAARNCYQSSHKKKCGSDKTLVKSLIKTQHFTPLEFISCRFSVVTNRAISHQICRHRLLSINQESQRFVNYSGKEIEFIKPNYVSREAIDFYNSKNDYHKHITSVEHIWLMACENAEIDYNELINEGLKPEQARGVLTNDTATKIEICTNLRELRLIFSLRCSKKADPMIRALFIPMLKELYSREPILFEDVIGELSLR